MKQTSMIRVVLPLLLTTLFGSCVIYHPHNVDIPLLHEEGQMAVDATFSTTAPLMGAPAFNATFSYAPFNHVGLQVAANLSNTNAYHVQGAGGGFLTMGENAVLEGYVGYGYGSSVHDSPIKDDSYYRVNGHYNLYFGQVNLGWVNLLGGLFDFGFGFKGGMLYPNFEKNYMQADGEKKFDQRLNGSHLLLQPQCVVRFGWQSVKISFNAGYAFLNDWPDNNYFNYEKLSVGLGVHFDL